MTYSECVSDGEYYICPSQYGDVSKTSCCVDSYGSGMCCVPESVNAEGDHWGYRTESPMVYYVDYLLILGASVILLVIVGLLCCEYLYLNTDEDNLYLIRQQSLTPEVRLTKPHEYNGNNFRVIREYNRHIDSAPSAPPSYYEEFDNDKYFESSNGYTNDYYNPSGHPLLYSEPAVPQPTGSTQHNYRPPCYAPGSSYYYK
ncbi:uncharacterized protein LOC117104071 [Anneissia japonica]|uniref:uncharacterized protein LOC117104071 n=1 Tax=Anneissia japonica TaxID=1529436 RepID=UPI0014258D35|nr:uncharacterized protein LOC117104071 [Anneissia japonica]XP_033100621.1 uncharacterized protein LOC117104071 [Anneissia japonica]XP_033100623.1 uncharacterized protein LOC117104071 [Anneissia japonica]XP_033100624.1 uncharacterized protein LOC117104071 [Anneissia japonica]